MPCGPRHVNGFHTDTERLSNRAPLSAGVKVRDRGGLIRWRAADQAAPLVEEPVDPVPEVPSLDVEPVPEVELKPVTPFGTTGSLLAKNCADAVDHPGVASALTAVAIGSVVDLEIAAWRQRQRDR